MIVQVKSKEDGKYLGYIVGYAIYDCVSWVLVAESVVAFTAEPLYNNRGQRLMFKLKSSDFSGNN